MLLLVLVGGLIGTSMTRAAKPPPPPSSCTLVPQLRDVTVNQGVGAYSTLVNGKETLVRFYLSMPSCAGSGASIQITGGTLAVSGGGTVAAPTPAPVATAYPVIATNSAAPMNDSTGDPKFVVPASMVTRATAFNASFSTTLSFQSRSTNSGAYSAVQQVTFTNRPGTSTPITAAFAGPSNAIGILFVPMGDATKSYSSQWTSAGQQALQDGMTATVSRAYPLAAGVGDLGGAAGLRYMVTPTLLDLRKLNLLDSNGKFCGTGANYDLIKAELAQFRLSHNTVNPGAQANRVVGVVDPAVGLGPPNPCFEGMAVVNSQEAWALALPGKTGQLLGLEVAHTLGLTPPSRESPFDGAHSQNVTAENPALNRRYNIVQRGFIVTDRSLMKPSATSPSPSNDNTLLEVPDFAFLHCIFGGPVNSECQTYGPGTVNANAPVAASLSFVMSGTTTSNNPGGLSSGATGEAPGTSVVESYFSSSMPQTAPTPSSGYRLVQRAAGGGVLSDLGVPVTFLHSGHHDPPSPSTVHSSGLFSFALPFNPSTARIELWKGTPGTGLLIYARNRTDQPVVTDMIVGGGIPYRPLSAGSRPGTRARMLATFTVTNTNDSGAGSLRQAIADANAAAGADTIDFAIPGSGVHTITPLSELPHLLQPTTIDGTTQPGYVAGGAPRIEISGTSAGGAQGLWIQGANSTIRGLTINRFAGNGVYVDGTASNTRLEANYVGLDATGALDAGNGNGIQSLSAGNTYGGPTPAARNVIAGNDGGAISINGGTTTVQGNYIGTTADGMSSLGNLEGITLTSNGNVIGGPNSGEGNVLSGSTTLSGAGAGVSFSSSAASNTIERNFIGTNKDGTAAIPNSRRGVYVGSDAGANNVIRGNTISGNSGDGIFLAGSGFTVVGNLIGTDSAGTAALPNTFGIQASGAGGNSTIGGTTVGTGNVISGNSAYGIVLNSADNEVYGNSIGTTAAGAPLPNTLEGILINVGTGNIIGGEAAGAANRIRSNGRDGVRISGGSGNRVSANEINQNGGLGIDLGGDGVSSNDASDGDTGPNDLQNFPVLTAVVAGASTTVSGTLNSEASKTYRLEFFASSSCDGSGNGEGETFLGSTDVTTGGSGDVTFTSISLPGGSSASDRVTATATDPAGNTSEFSACFTPSGGGDTTQPGPTFIVNTDSDGSPTTLGCTTTECTLREAIQASNAASGANTIEFDLPSDTQIALTSGLPPITGPVDIDGTSQPDGTVSLNGDGASETSGLVLATGSGGSTIGGLEIRDFFDGAGIRMVSGNNTVVHNTLWAVGDGIAVAGTGASGNQIGGSAAAGDGNRIWDFTGNGVEVIAAGSGNQIAGNTIGLDDDDVPSPGGTGIRVQDTVGTVIGVEAAPDELFGLDYDRGNVVVKATGDGDPGIVISSTDSDIMNTIVAGNFVGTDRARTATNLGNFGPGIAVAGTNNNQLGPGNTIAYNDGSGIDVSDGTGNRIVANSIHDNGGKGIDLIEGNDDLAEPELATASISGATTTVTGEISGVPNGTYFVEFFENTECDTSPPGAGEGETYIFDPLTVVVDSPTESISNDISGLSLGDVITTTLTKAVSGDESTSEFSNCVTVEEALPPGQESLFVQATDDNAADDTLDLYLDCGASKPLQVIAVGLRPSSVVGTTASWSTNYDSTLASAGCMLKAVVMDGFMRSGFTPTGTATVANGPNPLVAAISSPREDAKILQYGLIPLRGSIRSAQGELLTGSHAWELDGPGAFTRSGPGKIVDLQPPSGGWPAGSYTVTLSTPLGSATDSVTFDVLTDADNDGIPATVESSSGSCPLTGGDTDPLNAFQDKDGDGLVNASDLQPCLAATSYNAIIDINPDPLPTGSTGNPVTVYVQVPNRNVAQVLASTVRITQIAGADVSGNPSFKATAWTVSNGVGTAKFDRQKLFQYFAANNIHNVRITLVVAGSSGPPVWSFSGEDSTFVQG